MKVPGAFPGFWVLGISGKALAAGFSANVLKLVRAYWVLKVLGSDRLSYSFACRCRGWVTKCLKREG